MALGIFKAIWFAGVCALTLGSIFGPAAAVAQDVANPVYPSLEERKLGEPYTEEGEQVIYGRALPFLAQKVLDLGFELPRPYGVQLLGYWQEQDLVLSRLSISVDGGPLRDIDFVNFGTPSVENSAVQVKLDAWLLPFMNVYATLGKFSGDANIPLAVEGRDLLDFLGLGKLCTGGVLEPELCRRTLSAVAKPNYDGQNIVLGANLAMGWRDYFVTLPISYAWTEVDILNETVTALNITPRFGYLKNLAGDASLAMYLGATWLKAEVDISGTVTFDTRGSGVASLGDQTAIDFVIRQKNKDRWNYLAGFNWDISKIWSVQAEVGFGGSRNNLIGSLTYRW